MDSKKCLFDEKFTNLYELSKTLKFELRPVGEKVEYVDQKTGEIRQVTMTEKMLLENGVFNNDKIIQEKYQKTKPYFDRLHREFVRESLAGVSLTSLEEYESILGDWKNDKKNKEKQKRLQLRESGLRKQVVKFFDKKTTEWADKKYKHLKFKNKNTDLFFEEGIFALLKEKYGEEKDAKIRNEETGKVISIFDSWKGFTGYFTKFQETRKNFYKNDGTNTALATRIINQNLKRFVDNLQDFKKAKEKIDFSEVRNNFKKLADEVFSLAFYDKCLLQTDIDFYNQFIGGKVLDNGKKLRGINELINEYRQKNKGEKINFLKLLDKQILSEKEEFIDEIADDVHLLDVLKLFLNKSEEKIAIIKNLLDDFTKNNQNYDLYKVYISREALNTISRKWTNETERFEKALYDSMKTDKPLGLSYDKKENTYKFPDFIAIAYIKNALATVSSDENFWKERYYKTEENPWGFLDEHTSSWSQFLDVFMCEFEWLLKKATNGEGKEDKVIGFDIFKKDFESLIGKPNFSVNQESKIIIKNFADSILTIYQMAKYFALEKKRSWVDTYELDDFYTNPERGYLLFYRDAYEEIVQVYNKLRNYLTKKPFSEEKWKLNFGNSTLANGWDKNKESDNYTVILEKGGRYYLGVMNRRSNKIFSDENKKIFEDGLSDGGYRKVVYKLLPGPNKMLPKVFFSDSRIGFFNPSEEILNIRNHSSHTKGGAPQKGFEKKEFNLKDCHRLINFFKSSLEKHEEWRDFNFLFSDTIAYRDSNDFYREVERGGYKISFQDISEKYIQEKNRNGELYLFEIHSQDWNLKDGKKKANTKNLHTLYFENIFSAKNMAKNFPIKLNGQAELFFRPKTVAEKLAKKVVNGKEVIDHKRYNQDKIFFHCPITVNRATGNVYNFNAKVNNFLADNSGMNIIGVDRGEKHLAYYSVIKQDGEVIESGSLNSVNNINYGEKLETRARDRERARKDWQGVEDIKNLKKGYISQVIRKLADLAIKHNAIIVFEDLNMRFKQIRGGIEKSIYQQLEKALIDKLSFLVDKGEKNPEQAGHLLKAYQLVAPFETFKDMGKQTGIIFYTQASYTSKIDPVTGWRPNLYLKNTNSKTNKENILKFDKIKFNKEKNRFEFTYDLRKFVVQKEYPKKTKWTLCSCVERFRWNRELNNNKGGYVSYENFTIEFAKLFSDASIDVSENILEQIEKMDAVKNAKFFRDFIFNFSLLCQIRNTQKEKEGNDNDFIFSPVEPFFDSRKDNGNNLPKNGDDNGAYNIARKGIVILEKISEFYSKNKTCDKMGWGELYISHTDWDNFAQK
ncbi:MAG: type V CRISPR-associated protein Cas12a/Cpf1 [Candidatus Moraniibacteriota bacterium]